MCSTSPPDSEGGHTSLLIASNSKGLPGEGQRPQGLPHAAAIRRDGLGGGCWAGVTLLLGLPLNEEDEGSIQVGSPLNQGCPCR